MVPYRHELQKHGIIQYIHSFCSCTRRCIFQFSHYADRPFPLPKGFSRLPYRMSPKNDFYPSRKALAYKGESNGRQMNQQGKPSYFSLSHFLFSFYFSPVCCSSLHDNKPVYRLPQQSIRRLAFVPPYSVFCSISFRCGGLSIERNQKPLAPKITLAVTHHDRQKQVEVKRSSRVNPHEIRLFSGCPYAVVKQGTKKFTKK